MRRMISDRPWQRRALGAAPVVAAGVAAAALAFRALPDLVPEERLRQALATHAATWSGGELRLPAEAEVSIGRGPVMTVEGAEFRGASSGAEWQLDVASLRATFRVLPLLQGEVEIESLILDAPTLRFRDRTGPVTPAPRLPPAPRPEGRSPVGEVIVTNARVVHESASEQRVAIGDIDLRMAAEAETEAVLLTGAFPAGDGRLHIQGRLEDPAAVTGAGSEVRIALRGAASAADAGIPPPPPRPDLPAAAREGKVLSALRRIAVAVGLPGTGPLTLEGRVSATPRSLRIGDATMSFGGLLAEGDLSVALSGQAPTFDKLDGVVRGAVAAWTDASAAIEGGAWRQAPVALDWTAPLDISLAARLRDSRLAGTDLEARRIRLEAGGGRVRLEVAAAGELGRLQNELSLDAAPEGGPARLSLRGRLDDVEMGETGRVLLSLAPPPLVSPPQLPEGTLDAEFDVATSGDTLGAMLAAIDGVFSANVRGGSVTGADVVLTLEALAEGREFMTEEDGPLIPAAGRTRFDTVEARIDFVSGIARLSEFLIRGEHYAIDMSGEADLMVGEMRAEGQARLHGDAGGSDGSPPLVDLPFGFGGTLTAPVVAAGVPRRGGHRWWRRGMRPSQPPARRLPRVDPGPARPRAW